MRRLLAFVVLVLLARVALAGAEEAGEVPASKPVLTAQLGHTRSLATAVFSPDERYVLTASWDGTACLWEAETARVVRRYEWHGGQVHSAFFSPDGRHVLATFASIGEDAVPRLVETATGQEVQRYAGHARWVLFAAFSPDGRRIATAGMDGTARVWETGTGRELARYEGHEDEVLFAAFSPDGRAVLTTGKDGTARLWEAESGRGLGTFEGHSGTVHSGAFSPDGLRVVTAGEDGTARLWDRETGRELRRFEGHPGVVHHAIFSADGGRVLTAGSDGTARIWNAATGEEVGRHEAQPEGVSFLSLSADGRSALTAGEDGEAHLWDLGTGRTIRRYAPLATSVLSVDFSPDGRHALTAGWDGEARLWDLAAGREDRRFAGHTDSIFSACFSPAGDRILTASWDGTCRLWETEGGKEGRVLGRRPPEQVVVYAVFSPDGRRVAFPGVDRTVRVMDAETGEELSRLEGHSDTVLCVAFSPDGRQIATASADGSVRLWDPESGGERRRFEGHSDAVLTVVFSPDGRRLLSAGADHAVRLWEIDTGEVVRRYDAHTRLIRTAVFSPDGRRVLTAAWDDTARIWDAETGRELHVLAGHSSGLQGAAFSPDGRHVVTAGWDATARLWDAETGRELCSLISFCDGTWAVVDPQGRYDASRAGDVEGLLWVVGMETISLAQLKDRYYDPGLLAKHLGDSDEPLREVAAFDSVKLFPKVEVEPPGRGDTQLRIALANRGGGIGRVVVLVNGKEVAADARGGAVEPDQDSATLSLDLADDPRVRPGETNTIEVLAYNAEGYLRSRALKVEWVAPGEKAAEPPHLRAIVCGVSDYRTDAIDLRYAAKDAEAFAHALRLAAEGLFGEERVHVSLLATPGGKGTVRPTRAHLEEAFEAARAAGPDDLLVIYLAGHGVNVGGQDGDYHYLLAEAASADLTDPAVRRAVSVSSAELTEWIRSIPATRRQVLILDTCSAGRLIEDLTEARSVPASQVRALDRMKDRTGMFVLAGCAADQASYEASRYGQGLLTYSLLLGMRGGALRDDELVDVQRLFDFAADRVPELARDVGGIQRPVIAQPKGGASFDLGRLSREARERIPLPLPKPVFVRTSFQDDRRRRDTLRLSAALDEALRTAAAEEGTPLIFVDAREMSGAFELTGGYVVRDGKVTITALLWRGEEEVAELTVEGAEADVPALATRVVEAARRQLR